MRPAITTICFQQFRIPFELFVHAQYQLEYLLRIAKYFERITEVYPVSLEIARFVEALKNDIGYKDMATARLEELKNMREDMKSLPLPKERVEFENRAMLYQILNELEEFVCQNQFHQNNDQLYCRIRS